MSEPINVNFDNTSQVIPALKSLLREKGDCFRASSGNSSGKQKICHELRGVSFEIKDWSDRSEMMSDNGLSVAFAELDVADRFSRVPVNPGKAVEADTSGVLAKYLDEGGRLAYTYSERMCHQIDVIANLLRTHPETRQAFMSIWDLEIDPFRTELQRVPCSIGFHFLLRGERLDLIYYMRALEVSVCLGNDIYTSTRTLEKMAELVGVNSGTVTFMVGSLHYFEETVYGQD